MYRCGLPETWLQHHQKRWRSRDHWASCSTINNGAMRLWMLLRTSENTITRDTRNATMAKPRSRSSQHQGPLDSCRGRSDPEQQPELSYQQRPRASSSMSRGRTKRPTNEYTRPPRDLAAYETSSAEDFVYPDRRGGFSARGDTSDRSGPGRYQTRILSEFMPPVLAPGETFLRSRRAREARHQAAGIDQEATEMQQLSSKTSGQRELEFEERQRRGHGRVTGCCVIL